VLGQQSTFSSLNGVVAAAHPLAAQAGTEVMAKGGNAFDAAAACAAALNVVEPQMSGLAGMGLATCFVASERRVRTLDFVPAVGRAFRLPDGVCRDDLVRGALGIGGPGCLAGWCTLNASYGRLPLSEVLNPAIRLASGGFPLLELNVYCISETDKQLRSSPDLHSSWAKVFMPWGRAPVVGDVLVQPDLAGVFEQIAGQGPAYLYSGPLGKSVVDHVRSLSGSLTLADLAAFSPRWREPASIAYRGHRVYVSPPPSQGFQYLLALRVLEAIDLSAWPRNGVDHLDTVLRAIRLAAGVRIARDNPNPHELSEILGDDDVSALRKRLMSPEPICGPVESTKAILQEGRAAPEHTTSFSVADGDGNMVCLTQSLGQFFGSGIVVPGTGVCLNDMPAFGDLTPSSPTCMRPGAPFVQPMSPSIITHDGEAVLALGTPGSFGIMQTQVQALVQFIDYRVPLQGAISSPRIRLWDGARIEVEARIPTAVLGGLASRGHQIQLAADWTTKVGGMHGIARNPASGVLTGGFDPRRDGTVALL
jgi:gamma-glutamyltranspeptidase/glutathione hydrolase